MFKLGSRFGRGCRLGARLGILGQRSFLQGFEPGEQLDLHGLEEARGKLVQQLFDVAGRLCQGVEIGRARSVRGQVAQGVERMLGLAGEIGHTAQADGGRTTGELVRRNDGRIAERLGGIGQPVVNVAVQMAREFVGFGQVNVVERGRNAQLADLAVAGFAFVAFLGGHWCEVGVGCGVSRGSVLREDSRFELSHLGFFDLGKFDSGRIAWRHLGRGSLDRGHLGRRHRLGRQGVMGKFEVDAFEQRIEVGGFVQGLWFGRCNFAGRFRRFNCGGLGSH